MGNKVGRDQANCVILSWRHWQHPNQIDNNDATLPIWLLKQSENQCWVVDVLFAKTFKSSIWDVVQTWRTECTFPVSGFTMTPVQVSSRSDFAKTVLHDPDWQVALLEYLRRFRIILSPRNQCLSQRSHFTLQVFSMTSREVLNSTLPASVNTVTTLRRSCGYYELMSRQGVWNSVLRTAVRNLSFQPPDMQQSVVNGIICFFRYHVNLSTTDNMSSECLGF